MLDLMPDQMHKLSAFTTQSLESQA
jgi:hypothetical protein